MPRVKSCLSFVVSLLGLPALLSAQMVTTQSPLHSNTSSFYEYSHVGWSVHNPHYFMNFNGGGGTPPFGDYQPNAGLSGGFGVNNTAFDFGFGQGASLNSTTVTPMLTTTNGFPGYLFIGSERPFVTGVVPVVGGGFANVPAMGPLAARVATGQLKAEQGRLVVPKSEPAVQVPLRQANVARNEIPLAPRPAGIATSSNQQMSAAQYLEKAAAAEKDGRAGVAKIYYQLAVTKGDGLVKVQATRKLEAMKGSVTAR
ncbi:MAG TPA: hypothetical protein VGM98_10365 [Schlesneria sp.]|jgi:hypothetical protein